MFLSYVTDLELASRGVAGKQDGRLEGDTMTWLEYLRLKDVVTKDRDSKPGRRALLKTFLFESHLSASGGQRFSQTRATC